VVILHTFVSLVSLMTKPFSTTLVEYISRNPKAEPESRGFLSTAVHSQVCQTCGELAPWRCAGCAPVSLSLVSSSVIHSKVRHVKNKRISPYCATRLAYAHATGNHAVDNAVGG
jgi:hypothetical protein